MYLLQASEQIAALVALLLELDGLLDTGDARLKGIDRALGIATIQILNSSLAIFILLLQFALPQTHAPQPRLQHLRSLALCNQQLGLLQPRDSNKRERHQA